MEYTAVEKVIIETVMAHEGIDNKIGRKRIGVTVSIKVIPISDRALQNVIEGLRLRGEPICSTSANGGGYFWPKSEAEYKRFEVSQLSRIKHISKKFTSMRLRVRMMFAPEQLPLLEE